MTYRQTPPVGGNHWPVWLNCGYYGYAVQNENAVHSLEHGAVWITYRPGLPADQVAVLRDLAHRNSYVIVSPYPGLGVPIIASAWGRQLTLDSATTPEIGQFIGAFRLGTQAPERFGPCTGGVGVPS